VTFEPIDDETEDDAPDRPRRSGRRVRRRELEEQLAAMTVRAEEAEARLAELGDEWGVQSADSGRAQVCDNEDHARYLAARYSRFRLPGGESVRHLVVRRLATDWRDAEAAYAAPEGRSATETA